MIELAIYAGAGILVVVTTSIITKDWPDRVDFVKAVLVWPLIILLFLLPKSDKEFGNDGNAEEDR